MCDDLLQREVRGFDVKFALDDLKIRGDAAEKVVGVLVREVTKTQNLPDLAGG